MPNFDWTDFAGVIVTVIVTVGLARLDFNRLKKKELKDQAVWQTTVDNSIKNLSDKIAEKLGVIDNLNQLTGNLRADVENSKQIKTLVSEVKDSLEDIFATLNALSITVGKHGVRLDNTEEKFKDIKEVLKEIKDDIKLK